MKTLTLLLSLMLVHVASAATTPIHYTGEVFVLEDDLGVFKGVQAGEIAEGDFLFDTSVFGQYGLGGSGGAEFYKALSFSAEFGGLRFLADTPWVLVDDDVELDVPAHEGLTDRLTLFDYVTVHRALPLAWMQVELLGKPDWIDVNTPPEPTNLGFDKLVEAGIIIEFVRQDPDPRGDGPTVGGQSADRVLRSRALIQIATLEKEDERIVTIGCSVGAFAAPLRVADLDDVLAFVECYLLGDEDADVTGDGAVDTNDVIEFLQVFSTCGVDDHSVGKDFLEALLDPAPNLPKPQAEPETPDSMRP